MTSAMSISAAPPTSQATIASGPAICAAIMAPSSQPEPMTPLKPIAVSCHIPSDLRRWRSSRATSVSAISCGCPPHEKNASCRTNWGACLRGADSA
jgi:hypothetical protein